MTLAKPGADWRAIPPNVQHWIINILLHPMATGHYLHPTVLSEAEYDERRNAARAAINLLAAGTGYVLALSEPIKPEPPLNCNASKAEILENHEKRIAFLEKIACGGPVLYNEKRVLPLAEPPVGAMLPLGHEFVRQMGSGFADPGSRMRWACVARVKHGDIGCTRECGQEEAAHRRHP